MSSPSDYETLALGDWQLQSGLSLSNAHIAYKTFGDKSNPAIVYPTWYSGTISDNLWLIGEDKTLNPNNYFIIVPALFGNGQSSSPSNHPHFPPSLSITFYDNVRAQHHLVASHLGIAHLHAVLGWSMGAGQTYQWITQFPDFVDCAAPFCGSARTSLHNQVFLEGVKSALLAGKKIESGGVGVNGKESAQRAGGAWSAGEKEVGLKALGRVYAGWGFSQTFYREKLYETHYGYKSLEGFLVGFWEKWACAKDPENMLCMLQTWATGDCSKQEPYGGFLEKAMRAIRAKTLVMPCRTDLYFPPEDSEEEVRNMRPGIGTLAVFDSIWGHWAGGPGDSVEDVKWLDEQLKAFLHKEDDIPVAEVSKVTLQ